MTNTLKDIERETMDYIFIIIIEIIIIELLRLTAVSGIPIPSF